MMRYVAPAGAPIRTRDLLRWSRRWTCLDASAEELRSAIRTQLDRPHCSLVSTGRAALTVLLSALRSLAGPDRDEVILPSYTCYSVIASAIRAGLRTRVVDIDARTLDFDLEKLGNADFSRVVAIVATSLYGLPARFSRISQIAADRSVFLVDDAAQSLGATQAGRPAGGWGDAGILSFDKGKAVSAIEGGAIVSGTEEIAQSVRREVGRLEAPTWRAKARDTATLLAYVTCLRPELYWIPNGIPGLGLGRTRYEPDFPLQIQSRWLAALGATMWPRLGAFTSARVAVARRYRAELPHTDRLAHVEPVEAAEPSYLRYPVLVHQSGLRARLLRELAHAGIGATGSYPGSIADIPEVRSWMASPADAAVGRWVAGAIVTLPTHPFVTERDVERTITVVSGAVGGG